MNKIVQILMTRDRMTEEEAIELVEETRDEMLSADPFEAMDIMIENLNLESDYLMDLFE